MATCPLPAAAQQATGDGNQINFDIPAQPLTEAIEAFSASSGYQVLIADTAAATYRSAPIKGPLSPRNALTRIVAATGLRVRFTAATSVVLIPEPSKMSEQLTVLDETAIAERTRFDGALQGAILRALCRDAGLRRGDYRVALDVWIQSSGQVERVELLGSTGSLYLDDRIVTTLRGLASAPPPPGLLQPTTMLIGLSSSRPDEVCATAPSEPSDLRRAARR